MTRLFNLPYTLLNTYSANTLLTFLVKWLYWV